MESRMFGRRKDEVTVALTGKGKIGAPEIESVLMDKPAWEDNTNRYRISATFSRLVLGVHGADVLATIFQDVEIYCDNLHHWKTFSVSHNLHGTSATMEAAKRQCESLLGLGLCPERPNDDRC